MRAVGLSEGLEDGLHLLFAPSRPL
jgi:hypothetical protein